MEPRKESIKQRAKNAFISKQMFPFKTIAIVFLTPCLTS